MPANAMSAMTRKRVDFTADLLSCLIAEELALYGETPLYELPQSVCIIALFIDNVNSNG